MRLVASTEDRFSQHRLPTEGCRGLCIGVIRLALLGALWGFLWMTLGTVWGDTFLRSSMKWHLRRWFNVSPAFPSKTPAFLQLPRKPPTDHTQSLPLYHSASNKERNMSRYPIYDNSNCFNYTNSFNNVSNYTVADDRSPLLTWLSPLEPKLRHRDIQERRADSVGEWLLQTEEFRSWHNWSGEGEGDKAVLFCYGGPGVGKTFIR